MASSNCVNYLRAEGLRDDEMSHALHRCDFYCFLFLYTYSLDSWGP